MRENAGVNSRINFGACAVISLATYEAPTYFDVVNLDHFDLILGMPFLRAAGVCLDYGSNTVRLASGALVPTLEGEGTVERNVCARKPAPTAVRAQPARVKVMHMPHARTRVAPYPALTASTAVATRATTKA